MITSPSFTPRSLWQTLQRSGPVRRWLVGFSGGLDSTALLAALVAVRPRQPVIALHVNHGLSPRAGEWQAHCQARCAEWGVEFRAGKVEVTCSGRGLEDAARVARYRFFESQLEEGDALLLGHHRNDQAETLLFRLLRGAGPRGLGSIIPERPLGAGRLLRPLLKVDRSELESYLQREGLDWVDDESNQDDSFDRNFLRRRVLPVLAQRWPHYAEAFGRTAEACQQAELLSRDLGSMDRIACGERRERWGWSLDWNVLRRLPDHRQNNLLRYWALDRQFPPMEQKHLREARKQFLDPERPAGSSGLHWFGATLSYFRERLYLGPTLPPPSRVSGMWNPEDALVLDDGSALEATVGSGGLRVSGPVELRWRQGGERCRPAHRGHSQTLKKLLQEYELEPWLRDRVPLIYVNNQLAAVGDLWVCKGFAAAPGEPGYRLSWKWPAAPECGPVGQSD
ncbi:tRNA lysidine(34) synthetase TilS [Gilvimarinus sp. F26214L]|uniref:tRNA lysidine(34) synthetase TilS n=1 Tax=Gilvimarinus sp. DZF01 TaxID=3461371 RepID=UPI0040453974